MTVRCDHCLKSFIHSNFNGLYMHLRRQCKILKDIFITRKPLLIIFQEISRNYLNSIQNEKQNKKVIKVSILFQSHQPSYCLSVVVIFEYRKMVIINLSLCKRYILCCSNSLEQYVLMAVSAISKIIDALCCHY